MNLKKFLIVTLSVFAALMLAGVLPSCAKRTQPLPASEPEKSSGPKFVAHRGYSQYYVANTEESFRAAAELGFYGIETDILKTKDGYYVCNHDATVSYADGTEKRISSTKRSDLLAKPLKNDKNVTDVHLCTFENYLRACKAGDKVAVIELKDYFSAAEIREIFDIIDAEYDRKKVSFISFYLAPLLLIKEEDPSIPLQYLSQKADDLLFDRCLEEKVAIDVRQTILTEELISAFHEAGLTVNVWTINDEAALQSVTQMGVDYVTTDVFYEE